MTQKHQWLQFSGNDGDFPYWSKKFEAYMQTKGKGLRGKLLGTTQPDDANESYNIYAELVQCLDKRCVMMLRGDCKGDGPKAWAALKAHFSSTKTPTGDEPSGTLYISLFATE